MKRLLVAVILLMEPRFSFNTKILKYCLKKLSRTWINFQLIFDSIVNVLFQYIQNFVGHIII